MSGRFWTTVEDAVLAEHYERGGAESCHYRLRRSRGAIHQRARALGLRAMPVKRHAPYQSSEWIDAQIRRTYQRTPAKGDVAALAERVGRPRYWVSRRAAYMGLVSPRISELPWSAEELAILDRSETVTAHAVKRRLAKAGYCRTVTAIGVKRKRLGFRVDRGGYTARELAMLMGVDCHVVLRWIQLGMLSAKRAGTDRVEAQGGDFWLIRDRAVRRLIVDYTAEVDTRKCDKFWLVDVLTGHGGEKQGRAA